MFCQQCEQTASGQGCHQWGACGKSPEVNALQDLLIYTLRGLAQVSIKAGEVGISLRPIHRFMCESMFATMTNVNFSTKSFIDYTRSALQLRDDLKKQVAEGSLVIWSDLANYYPDFDGDLFEQSRDLEYKLISGSSGNIDIFSLKLMLIYGIKGLASYAFHAYELEEEDEEIYTFCAEVLAQGDRPDLTLDDCVKLALRVGSMNYRAMELLDAGHTKTYGDPVPTPVPLNHRMGKAILVSGHDIKKLSRLLEQTVGSQITVYTHGELLPAHGYPKLKQKYPHLYGHYGTAWQNQTRDFAKFPGAILLTTNCLMPPHETYLDQLFTTGPVGWSGVTHVEDDFSLVIEKALSLPGFSEESEYRQVLTGFAHNAVLSVADQVIAGVKSGAIRHFFLVGGCDGAKPDRNYYTELVEKVPSDCVVLTLACGKFRFFDKELGSIGDLPRLMDVGQCNDAYSAIQIALGLAKAFNVGVNELPLSMILSWYEQKAIAVLLTLLYLGIQNIRLGPTLPSFLSPNVIQFLADQYHLQKITTPDEDLAACLT